MSILERAAAIGAQAVVRCILQPTADTGEPFILPTGICKHILSPGYFWTTLQFDTITQYHFYVSVFLLEYLW